MNELAPLEIAVAGVVAENEAVEPPHVRVLVHDGPAEALGQGGDLLLDPLPAMLGVRVGREPFGNPAPTLRRAHAVEHPEHVGHLARIVIPAPHVAEAQVVRLALVVAGVLEEQHVQRAAREPRVALELRARDGADDEAHLRELLLRDPAGGVAGGDVADFVPHDAGQLRLRVEMGENPARHVDEAAGQGERVHHGIVDDVERPGEAGSLRRGGEPGPELLYVALQGRIRIEADGRRDLPVVLPPHLDLLGLADQRQLLRPGGGVRGARGGARCKETGRDAQGAGAGAGTGSEHGRVAINR